MYNLICDKCKGTEFTLLASRIQGMDKVVDVFVCNKCKVEKVFVIPTVTAQDEIDINTIPDFDEPEFEVLEDFPTDADPWGNDGGWDPSIG
jgi:protein-arginine kinase activator protein McsA